MIHDNPFGIEPELAHVLDMLAHWLTTHRHSAMTQEMWQYVNLCKGRHHLEYLEEVHDVGVVEIVVADNGPGFNFDDRFGTGHGLKNLQQRAQRLNGTCEIDSRLDHGTTIRFTAPLTRSIHVGRDGARDAGLVG